MAFRIKRKESAQEGVKRIIEEQIGKAESELAARDHDLHESIHQARKRCKKIRGLYRLVRPEIPKAIYKRENKRFRDAARELSAVRDAEAMTEAYDLLMDRFGSEVERRKFGEIRRKLTLRRNHIAESEIDIEFKVERFQHILARARKRLDKWSLTRPDFKVLEKGFKKTYQRGRKAMATALKKPTNENFHQWRKRVKYHRYHVRTLRSLWPEIISPLEQEVDRLGDLLGHDHDLAVLAEILHEDRKKWNRSADLETFLGLIETRRQELKEEARSLGKRLFAGKPKRVVKRLSRYWDAWWDQDAPLVV